MEIEYLQKAVTRTAEVCTAILGYRLTYELQIIEGAREYGGNKLDAKTYSTEIKTGVKAFSDLAIEVEHEIERNLVNLKKNDFKKYFDYCIEQIDFMLTAMDKDLLNEYESKRKIFLSKISLYHAINKHPALPELYEAYVAKTIIWLKEFLQKRAPAKQNTEPKQQTSLKEIFVTEDAYNTVMSLLHTEGFTDKASGRWSDKSKGHKGKIIALIHDLAYKNYYKNTSTIPDSQDIIQIARNTFGISISANTVKDATRSGNNTNELRKQLFSFIKSYK